MRNKILIALLVLMPCVLFAQQQQPVSWKYDAKKISDGVYEIHITADVKAPWHIYSQNTPAGGPVATKITFSKNPLISAEGEAKEVGSLIKKHEEVFGIDVKYYNQQVDFVQIIQLKAKVKTNINGSVKYMVCNDTECLPPATINFAIPINN